MPVSIHTAQVGAFFEERFVPLFCSLAYKCLRSIFPRQVKNKPHEGLQMHAFVLELGMVANSSADIVIVFTL
jgi:hypothetical protein